MFWLTTAVAIACAIYFTMPDWVGGLTAACVVISMPGVLTIVVVYGRGNTRAFGIGALFPASVCLFPFFSYFLSYHGVRFLGEMLEYLFDGVDPRILFLIFLNVYFAIVLGNGLLAVCVRRWLQSGQRLLAPPSPGGDRQPQPADAEPDAGRTGSEER
jgi:hypothetical protein